MTLDTRVYLLDQCDPATVFWACNALIGAPASVKWKMTEASVHNEPSQGLPAWLFVYHGNGDWLVKEAGHDADCNEGCTRMHTPKCWAEVSFDTAYGYRGPQGQSCGDLHAALVRMLGTWLDANRIRWCWRNEFTGDLHSRYEGLEELGPGGAQATAWFTDVVKPAIEAEEGAEGRNIEWNR